MTVEVLIEKLLLLPQHLQVYAEVDAASSPVVDIEVCSEGTLNDGTPVKMDPPRVFIVT